MNYLLLYLWKVIYGIISIVIIIGTMILGVKVPEIIGGLAQSPLFFIIIVGTIWIGGSYLLIKPLTISDKLLEAKASLDKEARVEFFVFATFVLISLAVFLASIYLFQEWLELINDTVHRTLDDYYTIIFPIVLFIASIGSFKGSFNLYAKYKDTVKRNIG